MTLPTREEVHEAWNSGWPLGRYDLVLHDYAYRKLLTAAEWRDTIEKCEHGNVFEHWEPGQLPCDSMEWCSGAAVG